MITEKASENATQPQIRDLSQAIIKTPTDQIEKLQQLSSAKS
ncbi:hypothetical protein ACSQ6I_25035 [Anabaena sp. WFMT]